ncbi:MAG: AAA family ATPase, partial [Alphaproteobacteria bacterium]|nr:AAA family ATPase [Alphaproteobacteria bacterium]
SLICSTLKYIYQGKKSLFTKTFLFDKIAWDNYNFPIIYLDLSVGSSSENLNKNLIEELIEVYHEYINDPIEVVDEDSMGVFKKILKYFRKNDQQIVIIMDEYDVPLNDNYNNEALYETNLNMLTNFFRTLKSYEVVIKKCFVTGVSRLGLSKVFSGANNFTDISFTQKYACLCGLTENEFSLNYSEFIQRAADEYQISREEFIPLFLKFYNGFSFNGKDKLINPYSTNLFFKENKFLLV